MRRVFAAPSGAHRIGALLAILSGGALLAATVAIHAMAGPACSGSHGSMNAVGIVVIAAALAASVVVGLATLTALRLLALADLVGAALVFYYAWATFSPMFDCSGG